MDAEQAALPVGRGFPAWRNLVPDRHVARFVQWVHRFLRHARRSGDAGAREMPGTCCQGATRASQRPGG